MPPPTTQSQSLIYISKQVNQLCSALSEFSKNLDLAKIDSIEHSRRFFDASGRLISSLQSLRAVLSPVRIGDLSISLGRSDGIAKFFAFSLINRERLSLEELESGPFFGSGVYAIYYIGKSVEAYNPVSGTETPVYVGKADPANPNSESVEEQGQAIFRRLCEHAKNIRKTDLTLSDFQYRAAPIQSGMQSSVEDFMIRLFKPIWNKQTKICFGLGKHGDSASTRRNKRSPWDTMHPGRQWANNTTADQFSKTEIESRLIAHFQEHPPIRNRDQLLKLLALG